MRKSVFLAVALCVLPLLGGCSIVGATLQPGEKNLVLLQEGTPRHLLVGEFGEPLQTAVNQVGEKVELFSFVDGFSVEERAGRAAFHAIADIGTLGFWELAGTPIEHYYNGTEMLVQVTYNKSDVVTQVVELKRK